MKYHQSKAPRRIMAQLTATATFRLLMALVAALFIAGFVLGMPARLIVEAAPAAVAMLLLQTGKGDGCRLAAGIGLVWLIAMAGILLAPLHPAAAAHLGPLTHIHPLGAAVIGLISALMVYISMRAPTEHHFSTRALFFLLGVAGEIAIIELTLSPYFSGRF